MKKSMPQQLLSVRQVAERISFGRAWIYQMMSDGKFPKPFQIGERAVRWTPEQIDTWVAKQTAATK